MISATLLPGAVIGLPVVCAAFLPDALVCASLLRRALNISSIAPPRLRALLLGMVCLLPVHLLLSVLLLGVLRLSVLLLSVLRLSVLRLGPALCLPRLLLVLSMLLRPGLFTRVLMLGLILRCQCKSSGS